MTDVLESLYRVMLDDKSFCPQCATVERQHPVNLLTTGRPNLPAFYICDCCLWIGEVGVGRVLRVAK